MSGGIGILIGVIAAATAGVIAYAAAYDNSVKEICNAVDDIEKSHEDAIRSIDKKISSDLAEAEVAKTLKNSLYDLEDQLKSGTLSQEEAQEAQENFNVIAEKLNSIIPGIISSIYDENGAIDVQRDKVDDLTNSYYDLAVAKAMATAYEEKMTETSKSLIEAKELQETARTNLRNTSRTANRTYTLLELPTMLADTSNHTNAKNALKTANETVSKLEDKLKIYEAGWTEATNEVKKLVKQTTKTVEDGNNQNTNSTITATKEQSKAVEEQCKKELRDLEFYHDMGQISDEDYYEALEKYRDKYFDEGSEEWQKYTLQIQKYNEDLEEKSLSSFKSYADEQQKIAEESINEIKDIKDNMENSLKSYGSLFSQYQLPTIEIGGASIAPTKTELSDISKQNEELRKYSELLNKLKSRSDIPTNLLSEISKLSVSDGTSFINELLKLDDAEFKKYLSDLKEQEKLTSEISGNFVADEIDELKTSLEEKFGTVPEEFFGIGETSAEQFGSGFMSQLNLILQEAKEAVFSTLGTINPILTYAGAGGNGNVSNSYSSTYYLQPPKDEGTQEQIKVLNDWETRKKMSGGY